MLKQGPVSSLRRRVGVLALVVLADMVAGVVYAATTMSLSAATADYYSLKMGLSFNGEPAHQFSTVCRKPGAYAYISSYTVNAPLWQGRVAVFPAEKGELEIRTEVRGGTLSKPVQPIVRTMPGQPVTIEIGNVNNKDGSFRGLKLVMTPKAGC